MVEAAPRHSQVNPTIVGESGVCDTERITRQVLNYPRYGNHRLDSELLAIRRQEQNYLALLHADIGESGTPDATNVA